MTCDIIVIGGGPAGGSAALRAARLGARVLLLEKKQMPRPKLCGGWVSNYALRLLPFELPAEIVEAPFREMELTDGANSICHSSEQSLGVFVDRAVFDHHLMTQAQAAGTEVRWEKALGISHEQSVIHVRTASASYAAGGVIICTGAASDLVTQVRPPDKTRQSAVCLEQRVSVSFAGQLAVSEGGGRFHFGVARHGFGWVLHHGSYLLVGAGQRRDKSPDVAAVFARYWDLLKLPRDLKVPTGHLVPLGGYSRRLGYGRCLLAGDAAGMVDAQNGEGIAGAIESGQMAAEALATDNRSDAAAVYTALCKRSLLPHLRWSRRFAGVFYSDQMRALKLFRAVPSSLRAYAEVLERKRSYRRYLLWLAAQSLKSIDPVNNTPPDGKFSTSRVKER